VNCRGAGGDERDTVGQYCEDAAAMHDGVL